MRAETRGGRPPGGRRRPVHGHPAASPPPSLPARRIRPRWTIPLLPPAAPAARRPEAPARRGLTAEEMAKTQREISVAEFFAKNRHLLGYDNPAKALLTAVREAVDNALDACEEAGILPDLEVALALVRAGTRIRADDESDPGKGGKGGGGGSASPAGDPRPLPPRGHRQRAGHRPGPDRPHLREAPLRVEVPPAAHEPRAAGDRDLGGRALRAAHHRTADPDHQPDRGEEAGPRGRDPHRHPPQRAPRALGVARTPPSPTSTGPGWSWRSRAGTRAGAGRASSSTCGRPRSRTPTP